LLYSFEGYALDTDVRELRRGGTVVAVQPQVFDLLEYLVRNRDRVITKDDLIAAVWHGRIVSESALTTRINAARTAIGDSGEEQRLIRTLPRKGVRFIGEIREVLKPTSLPLPEKPSIAVLPFSNMSDDPEQEYFADGITEDIITSLSKWHWFFVIARNSSFTYKARAIDIKRVGQELGVRYVLEGSVRRVGDRLRLNAQLIDAVTGTHIWAERFDRDFVDVFAVQDELTHNVAAAIGPAVSKIVTEQATRKSEEQLAAYDHYLRGMWHLHQFTDEALGRALVSFRHAIELDQSLAHAHAGMARALLARTMYHGADRKKSISSALEAARRALALDSENVEAYYALAIASSHNDDPDVAFEFAQRATKLNDNFAPGLFALGIAELYLGLPNDALESIDRALRLNPTDPQRFTWLSLRASALYLLKRYPDAIICAKQSLGLKRYHTALRVLAAANAQLGMKKEAADAMDELMACEYGDRTIEAVIRPFRRATDRANYTEGLAKAGLPEI
jgi:adenylate cyclase